MLISLAEWKKDPKADAVVVKRSPIPLVEKTESGDLIVGISSGHVDRDNDTVDVSKVKTDSYRKNPVVLWAHDRSLLPVAKSSREFVENGYLKSVPTFPEPGLHPFADTVRGLAAGGFINAASIGFRVREWTYNEERRGYDFGEIELLEWSFVPIPSNPEALIGAKALGVDTSPLLPWMEEEIARLKGPGFWMTRAELATAIKAIAPVSVQVPAGAPVGEPEKADEPEPEDEEPAPTEEPEKAESSISFDAEAIRKSIAEGFAELRLQLTGRLPE